jgi:histidinol-phosphatase (PHP family)
MSDGKNTVREVIASARALGFCALGFSDHSHTAFDLRYCLRPATGGDRYEEVIRAAAREAREQDGFPIFLGVEFDAFSENVYEHYDYTIGSVHYVRVGESFYDVDHTLEAQQECVEKELKGNKLDFVKRYYEILVEHARRNRPTILGHFDVLTKFGYFDENDPAYRAVALEAMEEIVRYVPIFEVNTGAISRGWKTLPYPASFLLEELHRLGGRVMLNSDSHAANTLDCAFPDALERIRAAGFTKLSRLTENGMVEDDI